MSKDVPVEKGSAPLEVNSNQNFTLAVALNTTADGQQRTFPLAEQPTALSLMTKIQKNVDVESDLFIDGELELNTAEKALALKVLDREWPVASLKQVIELRTLLS